jgi:hypothetical protein
MGQKASFNRQSHSLVLETLRKFSSTALVSQNLQIQEGRVFELLANLYGYVTKYLTYQQKEEIARIYTLFPDQTGTFQICSKVSLDLDIEDTYKDLCQRYQYHIRNKLLKKELSVAAQDFVKATWNSMSVMQIINASINSPNQRDPNLLRLDGEKDLLKLSLDVIRLLPRAPTADPQSNASQHHGIDMTLIE